MEGVAFLDGEGILDCAVVVLDFFDGLLAGASSTKPLSLS